MLARELQGKVIYPNDDSWTVLFQQWSLPTTSLSFVILLFELSCSSSVFSWEHWTSLGLVLAVQPHLYLLPTTCYIYLTAPSFLPTLLGTFTIVTMLFSVATLGVLQNVWLGGGFIHIFYVDPDPWGFMIQFDERAYFSNGLVKKKPPTICYRELWKESLQGKNLRISLDFNGFNGLKTSKLRIQGANWGFKTILGGCQRVND